jgi:hypothetical protein
MSNAPGRPGAPGGPGTTALGNGAGGDLSPGQPTEEWRPLADRIAGNARDFLDGLAAVALGEGADETVPLLLLETAQMMLAGAQLGASKDVILPSNWEPGCATHRPGGATVGFR